MEISRLSAIWYITRKFPPNTGGMQRLALHIASEFTNREPTTLLYWSHGNWGLPWFMGWAMLKLVRGLVAGKVRVLLLGDPVLSLLGLIAKRFGVPVAVVVHGLDVTYPVAPYQAYLRFAFRDRFDAYICISRFVQQRLQEKGTPAHRCILIHPGVDAPQHTGTQEPIDRHPRLLLLGRLVRRKGALWFVEEVMPALLGKIPNLHLDIIGTGPERSSIQDAIERNNLGANVRLLGEVSQHSKQAAIREAHLVIMPNLPVPDDPEGFGLVALEAAMEGRYVYAANLEGLQDSVVPGRNGQLLPAGDSAAWIDAIDEACRDLPRLMQLGERAKDFVRIQYSWSRMGERYLEALHALE